MPGLPATAGESESAFYLGAGGAAAAGGYLLARLLRRRRQDEEEETPPAAPAAAALNARVHPDRHGEQQVTGFSARRAGPDQSNGAPR
jgi:uncharacterized protein (TIGR03382 family)